MLSLDLPGRVRCKNTPGEKQSGTKNAEIRFPPFQPICPFPCILVSEITAAPLARTKTDNTYTHQAVCGVPEWSPGDVAAWTTCPHTWQGQTAQEQCTDWSTPGKQQRPSSMLALTITIRYKQEQRKNISSCLLQTSNFNDFTRLKSLADHDNSLAYPIGLCTCMWCWYIVAKCLNRSR